MEEIIWEEEKAKMTNLGDMRVSYMRNGDFFYVDVKTEAEAAEIIDVQSQADLVSNLIAMNGFDLERFEDNGNANDPDWYTYYNEEGDDINEIMDN